MNGLLNSPLVAASYVILWVVVAALAVTVVAQLHYMGLLFKSLDPFLKFRSPGLKLQPGERLPRADLVDEFGGIRDVARTHRPQVLLFVNTTCEPCQKLLSDLADGLKACQGVEPLRELAVIVLGGRNSVRLIRDRHPLPDGITVLADPGANSIQRWGIARTPTAVPLDAQSRILSIVETPTAALVLELMGVRTEPAASSTAISAGTALV